MGPRLGNLLHDLFGGLDAWTRPQGLFWRRCTIDLKWKKVACEHMVLFCSDASDSVRPSRGPFWQPACPFLASGDHFRPCQGPAPTDAVAVYPGRPAAAAGMMPWARGLAFLSRLPIWCLAHKKKCCTPGGGPVSSKNSLRTKSLFSICRL